MPPQQGPDAAVLLTFDDGRADFYTTAFPAMQTAGIQATNYVIPGLLDTAGYITTAQAQEIYAAGHDIGNHSNTHPQFDTLTQAQIEAELSDAKAALDAAGMTRASAHVAYPYGQHDSDALAAMTATGMLTGRTTHIGFMTPSEVNATWGLNNLPIYYVYNTTNIGDLQNAITYAGYANKIICLLFHSIADVEIDAYYWATPDFSALLAWLNAESIPTLTITEWYARYKAIYP